MKNYLDPLTNDRLKIYLEEQEGHLLMDEDSLSKLATEAPFITAHERSYAVQKIFELCDSCAYRDETVFMAVGIFDRYLAAIGHWNYPLEKTCKLAVCSVLLAAKMNERLAPNFMNMILRLSEEEQDVVT